MQAYREDCVHYEACRRVKKNVTEENPDVLVYLDCWCCDEYVSRYDVMEWWHEGLKIGYEICGMKILSGEKRISGKGETELLE